LPFPPPSLRSRIPETQLGSLGNCGSAVRFLSRVWGGALAEIEFGAFLTKNVTSSGDNFNDFSENQLTKSLATYTVKANRGRRKCGSGKRRSGKCGSRYQG